MSNFAKLCTMLACVSMVAVQPSFAGGGGHCNKQWNDGGRCTKQMREQCTKQWRQQCAKQTAGQCQKGAAKDGKKSCK